MGENIPQNMKHTLILLTLGLITFSALSVEAAPASQSDESDIDALWEQLSLFKDSDLAPLSKCQGKKAWSNLLQSLHRVFDTVSDKLDGPIDDRLIGPAVLRVVHELKSKDLQHKPSRPDTPMLKAQKPGHGCVARGVRPFQIPKRTKCTPSKYPIGSNVEVMVLSPGQQSSERWIPGVVENITCDGRYTLRRPEGGRISPALKTGIEAHHLRIPLAIAPEQVRRQQPVPQPSDSNKCVPVVYPPKQKVEVMELAPGEMVSERWVPAIVRRVSCDGKYTLEDEDGNPITPALKSGIEAYHLRGLHEGAVEEQLARRVAEAQKALEEAMYEAGTHKKHVQARQHAARAMAEERHRKNAEQAAREEEAKRAAVAKEKESRMESSKAKLADIDTEILELKQKYEHLAMQRQESMKEFLALKESLLTKKSV